MQVGQVPQANPARFAIRLHETKRLFPIGLPWLVGNTRRELEAINSKFVSERRAELEFLDEMAVPKHVRHWERNGASTTLTGCWYPKWFRLSNVTFDPSL